jgi:hypothetical protein
MPIKHGILQKTTVSAWFTLQISMGYMSGLPLSPGNFQCKKSNLLVL